MPSEVAYFLADAHLGTDPEPEERAREARLIDFLKSIRHRPCRLFVLGDLFDFWFEYRTAIPRRFFQTLAALREVRDAGIEIRYLVGNHDSWLGEFMAQSVGIEVHQGPLAVELQGRRIWLHHGDGLVGGDLGYRVLKKVIRSPISTALYRLIHPDLGIPFAHLVSTWSRRSREGRSLDGPRLVREIAEPRFAEGHDAVLVGHFHHPFEHRAAGRDFFVLGDWITQFSYAVLEDGRFRLETWPEVATTAQNWVANENRWVSPRSSRIGT